MPALASQLQALHAFDEDLREALGLTSLYNVSLGTTADEHLYDRLEDRDEPCTLVPGRRSLRSTKLRGSRHQARGSKHRQAAVVLAGYCAFLQLYATQPLLPMLRSVFHTGEVAVSLTVTMASLGVAISAPFAGMLADRIGRSPVIVWSAFLLALTALATASATTLPQLLMWRFLQGVFTPGVFAVTVAYINDEWRDAAVGRVVAAYISGTVMGGFSSRMISGLVAAHAPWPRVFLVLGGLNLILAAVIAVWLPPAERKRNRSTLAPRRGRGWSCRRRTPRPIGNCWRRSWSAFACCFRWWASSPT